MVNTGDWIILDGKTVQVTARWASGKHTQFVLSDGRKLIDLHKNPAVQIVSQEIKKEPPQPKEVRRYTHQDGKQIRGERPVSGTVDDLRDEVSNGEDLLD